MITAIPENQILELLQRQLGNHFGMSSEEADALSVHFPDVLGRISFIFTHTANKYYSRLLGGKISLPTRSIPANMPSFFMNMPV